MYFGNWPQHVGRMRLGGRAEGNFMTFALWFVLILVIVFCTLGWWWLTEESPRDEHDGK